MKHDWQMKRGFARTRCNQIDFEEAKRRGDWFKTKHPELA